MQLNQTILERLFWFETGSETSLRFFPLCISGLIQLALGHFCSFTFDASTCSYTKNTFCTCPAHLYIAEITVSLWLAACVWVHLHECDWCRRQSSPEGLATWSFSPWGGENKLPDGEPEKRWDLGVWSRKSSLSVNLKKQDLWGSLEKCAGLSVEDRSNSELLCSADSRVEKEFS